MTSGPIRLSAYPTDPVHVELASQQYVCIPTFEPSQSQRRVVRSTSTGGD